MEFIYSKDLEKDIPTMWLNGTIGNDNSGEFFIDSNQFINELYALDSMGKGTINVMINSKGGNVIDGWAIFNAIKTVSAKVDTYNIGLCASIASVIFQAGRQRCTYEGSLLMIHNPFFQEQVTDEQKKSLDKFKESIITMLTHKTKLSVDKISDMMNETTWLNADECLNLSLCDKIIELKDLNKSRMLNKLQEIKNKCITKELANNKYNYFCSVLNSYINEKETIMNENFSIVNHLAPINQTLGLIPEANSNSIISAIDRIRMEKNDILNSSKKEIDDMKEKMKAMKDNYDKVKEEYDKMKNETSEFLKDFGSWEDVVKWMNKMKDKEKADKEEMEKAKNNLINNYLNEAIQQGKISASHKNIWEYALKNNYEQSIEELKNLSININMPSNSVLPTEIKAQPVSVELPAGIVNMGDPINKYQAEIINKMKENKTGIFFEKK